MIEKRLSGGNGKFLHAGFLCTSYSRFEVIGGWSKPTHLAKVQLEVMLERAARSVLVQPRDAKHTIFKRRRQFRGIAVLAASLERGVLWLGLQPCNCDIAE